MKDWAGPSDHVQLTRSLPAPWGHPGQRLLIGVVLKQVEKIQPCATSGLVKGWNH